MDSKSETYHHTVIALALSLTYRAGVETWFYPDRSENCYEVQRFRYWDGITPDELFS